VIAQVMTTIVVIILSYLGQKHFSFKTTPKEEEGITDLNQ
jgi:hypothetical protein